MSIGTGPKSSKTAKNMVDNIEHISDDWQDGSTINVLQEMTMLAM